MFPKTSRVLIGAVMVLSSVACGTADLSGSNGDLDVVLRIPPVADSVRDAIQGGRRTLLDIPERRLPTVDIGNSVAQPPTATVPGQCQVSGQASAQVLVAAAPTSSTAPKLDARFVVGSTPRIYLGAVLRNVCGSHTGSFDLYTPQGEFYARLSTPFSTTAGGAVRYEGQALVVELQLPVAGTEIEARGLYGRWSINYVQDQSDLALGLGEFELVAE